MTTYTPPVTATAEQLSLETQVFQSKRFHVVRLVFEVFRRFIDQNPDLDTNNYYNPADLKYGFKSSYYEGRAAYRQELSRIAKDGTRARKALKEAQTYPFSAQAMVDAQRAFSGRLQIVHDDKKGLAIDYTTGQYWPTEYRIAAAAVLERYCDEARPKFTPGPGAQFFSVDDLEKANYNAGGHWFSRENKRFFRSRILPEVYQGHSHVFFVSSEKRGFDDNARVFTARVFDCATADVNTLDGPGRSTTRAQAISAAKHAADLDRTGQHFKPATDAEKCGVCGHYRQYCTGKEKTTNGDHI